MLNFNSILLFSEKPKELAEFYQKIFDKKPEWQGGDYVGWMVGSGFFTIGPHDKVKGKNNSPERMMLNLETADVQVEFDRIKKLGAKVVAEPYHPSEDSTGTIATLADPDNNYFQLVTPMNMSDAN
jgi:predicted enzyme related to lactoylglutathione lyase